MPEPFFSHVRPLVFAHRGGSALRTENTMAAFEHALALGVDGLELDVQLSRDGVVVVHHDAMLGRVIPLEGPVSERTARELAAVDVPSLADVLARCPDVRVIVEMKTNTVALAYATLGVVRAAGAAHRVCLGSFGRGVLRVARRLAPEMATSAAREEVRWDLYRSWLGWAPSSSAGYGGYQVPEWAGRIRVVSPRFVALAHRKGLRVHVWTVDTEGDARRLLEWGVDGLITDRPDAIVPIVQARRA